MQDKEMTLNFLQLVVKCKAVIAFRMSPKQKGDLIQLMKENDTSKIILAIGDGANDVSMIT
jgi:P-type E1-E2 ATPase